MARDAERLRRFETEARAIAALNHPNILSIHDIGTFEGAPYLVSECLEGQTLRQELSSGPLPLRRVVEYGREIVQGLAAAHEKGIIHRDLKPAVYRLDLATGKRELVATLAPRDPDGVTAVYDVRMTADNKSYGYSFYRELSDLFLVQGVR